MCFKKCSSNSFNETIRTLQLMSQTPDVNYIKNMSRRESFLMTMIGNNHPGLPGEIGFPINSTIPSLTSLVALPQTSGNSDPILSSVNSVHSTGRPKKIDRYCLTTLNNSLHLIVMLTKIDTLDITPLISNLRSIPTPRTIGVDLTLNSNLHLIMLGDVGPVLMLTIACLLLIDE